MADINYCRRENAAGIPCGRRISRANLLHWCDECRNERLPLWPANDADDICRPSIATEKVEGAC